MVRGWRWLHWRRNIKLFNQFLAWSANENAKSMSRSGVTMMQRTPIRPSRKYRKRQKATPVLPANSKSVRDVTNNSNSSIETSPLLVCLRKRDENISYVSSNKISNHSPDNALKISNNLTNGNVVNGRSWPGRRLRKPRIQHIKNGESHKLTDYYNVDRNRRSPSIDTILIVNDAIKQEHRLDHSYSVDLKPSEILDDRGVDKLNDLKQEIICNTNTDEITDKKIKLEDENLDESSNANGRVNIKRYHLRRQNVALKDDYVCKPIRKSAKTISKEDIAFNNARRESVIVEVNSFKKLNENCVNSEEIYDTGMHDIKDEHDDVEIILNGNNIYNYNNGKPNEFTSPNSERVSVIVEAKNFNRPKKTNDKLERKLDPIYYGLMGKINLIMDNKDLLVCKQNEEDLIQNETEIKCIDLTGLDDMEVFLNDMNREKEIRFDRTGRLLNAKEARNFDVKKEINNENFPKCDINRNNAISEEMDKLDVANVSPNGVVVAKRHSVIHQGMLLKEDNLANGLEHGDVKDSKNDKRNKKNGKVSTNHKLTDYFPVRRSVRKTSKSVQAEKMRDIEMAIRDGREDGLKVECFEGKGRGVVAERAFRRGQFVLEYAGELIPVTEARAREQAYARDAAAGCYMYYFRNGEQQYCIDATAESGRLGRLVNHSRNGNLVTKVVFVNGLPRLVLLAGQDIAAGEEITYDYGDRSKESLKHHPWLAL